MNTKETPVMNTKRQETPVMNTKLQETPVMNTKYKKLLSYKKLQ